MTSTKGTFQYLAPELRDEIEVKSGDDLLKCDVWSLGLVIFDIMGYSVASRKVTSSMWKQTSDVKDIIHVIMDQINIPTDSELITIAKKCLITNPAVRPNIHEIMEDIENVN